MYPSPFLSFQSPLNLHSPYLMPGFVKFFLFTSIYGIANMFDIIIWVHLLLFLFLFKKIKLFSHLRAFLANPGSRYTEARFGIYYLYWSQCKFKSYVLRLKNYPGKWFKGTTTNISEEIFLIWSDQNTFPKRCYDMKIFIVHVGKLCFAK